MTESEKQRINRCKGCEYATISPLEDVEETYDELYCTLMGYPCDMIIICDLGKQ